MGHYTKATICLNGHVTSSTDKNYLNHCKQCGKQTVSSCQNCKTDIQGDYSIPGLVFFSEYDKPFYCHECGNPYPWTNLVISNAIELISLDEHIPEDHKEIIKNAIPDLITDTPSSPVAVAKYKKFTNPAATYIKDGLKNILVDVVSETVKKSIWG